MSVGIDSMVLIWGLKKPHHKGKKSTTQNVPEMQRRSWILLEQLHTAKETIIVPTVAVAEVLLGIELKDHGTFVAELQERYFIPPFDLSAMALAARLWQAHRRLPKAEQIERACLKADVMIVATAKVAGASKFYSYEPKVQKLAQEAGMTGCDLPEHSEDMFIDLEARKATGDTTDANQDDA